MERAAGRKGSRQVLPLQRGLRVLTVCDLTWSNVFAAQVLSLDDDDDADDHDDGGADDGGGGGGCAARAPYSAEATHHAGRLRIDPDQFRFFHYREQREREEAQRRMEAARVRRAAHARRTLAVAALAGAVAALVVLIPPLLVRAHALRCEPAYYLGVRAALASPNATARNLSRWDSTAAAWAPGEGASLAAAPPPPPADEEACLRCPDGMCAPRAPRPAPRAPRPARHGGRPAVLGSGAPLGCSGARGRRRTSPGGTAGLDECFCAAGY